MQEQELLKRIQSGDHSAFRELYEMYASMVFNVSCRMLGNRHESEDVTQDVFISAYRSIKEFRSDSRLSTWLYRIAVNHCLNHQARKKREKWISLDVFSSSDADQHSSVTISKEHSPDRMLERRETEVIVQNAINTLPKQQRIALVLHRYEGLSYDEIAKIMECSVSSVESRIFRAKQNLYKKLLPYMEHL